MLYQDEKDLIVEVMKMFANTHMGEDLIKQTARYVSAKITTWKRKSVYDYSRLFYTDKYKELADDAYVFEVNGKIENWFCVLWYDGPRIFEDAAESRIMVQSDELGILERFDIIHCSNETYTKMVEDEKSTRRKTQETLQDRGIREEQVFMFYNRMNDIFIQENIEHKQNQPYIIHPWSDKLYETNPEWFI